MTTLARRFLLLVLILLAHSACGTKVRLYAAPATLAGGVHVKVYDAYARGDRIYVKSYLTNASSDVLRVDRDGWALRLASGEVLPRSVGVTTQHDVYTLEPGQGHEVFVDFRKEGSDLSSVRTSTLIVGGIGYGSDMQSRIAGEISLSVSPPPAEQQPHGPAQTPGEPPPAPPPVPAPAPAPSAAPEPAPADAP